MIPIVYDDADNEGIILCFDLENGMTLNIFMDDDNAENFINIIQNKLNNRIYRG